MEPARGAGQAHRQPLLAWEAGEQWPAKHCCLQINSLELGEELFVLTGVDVAPAAPPPPPQLRFSFPFPCSLGTGLVGTEVK